ncbi:MAG: SGNH/GDSL hydrolase family protein [Fuerstiella sp.]|nr:SGNH/GDSL hydrolase family protein [Fuerstiella sp.]MCP4782731.1 SGNH/GDSL hydrolase family protein [Fuerstiella sp.]MCP4855162.1 SGNH/GDSL hydrolase family protein [Fuerstiella sp.]
MVHSTVKPSSSVRLQTLGMSICWMFGIVLVAAAVAFSVSGGFGTKVIGGAVLAVGSVTCGLARCASSRTKLRIAAFMISFSVMLLSGEMLLRSATHFPVNTVSNRIPHAELGYVLDPDMKDVDASGFRNPSVPETVDIVAIGDSHTQGFNVAAGESWPSVLGRQLNMSVYNSGVAGYGPLQYETLTTRALKLQPRQIVVGFYTGNDLGDVARGIVPRDTATEIDNHFRYGIKYHTALGSAASHLWQRSQAARPPGLTIEHSLNPTFVADRRLRYRMKELDLTDSDISAAFGRTLQIFEHIQRQCVDRGINLLVMLLPTRESVYSIAVQREWPEEFTLMVRQETLVRTRLQHALHKRHIRCLDVLPNMVAAVKTTSNVYASYDDGHPLSAGYEAYATAAARAMAQVNVVQR